MAFAGPVNSPSALNLITAVRIRFMEAYAAAYGSAAYSDYQDFTYLDDPAGDLIYTIYAEPMKPMPAWLGDRHMSSTDFRYWTQAVRTFGDGMELDVDDIKADSGNEAKARMYLMTAERFADAAKGLWPSLVAETVIKGISSIWLPDGQNIFDLHPYSPSNSSLGNFRNYYANNAQGGGAVMPLNYANLLANLKSGLTFKAPTGLDYPIRYGTLVVPPGSAPTARRLTSFPMLPVAEIFGQTLATTAAGGTGPNEIQASYAPTGKGLANMPAGTWMLLDTDSKAEMSLALKKRQDITWQFTGPGGAVAPFPTGSDDGMVSEAVFSTNKSKFGPKARGEGFFRNWWRAMLCDGNTTPVTTLAIL